MRKRKFQVARPFTRALLSALTSLNTPIALSVYLLIKGEEWDQLACLGIDPLKYLDTPTGVHRYFRDAQAIALVKKVPWPTSFSRKKAAEETFRLCEAKCASTNHFIDWVTSGVRPQDRFLEGCREILATAKKLASYVLGPIPDELFGRFGPGTVYELKGSPFATLADKVCITPHVTESAYACFRHATDGTLWSRQRDQEGLPHVSFSPGNRFTTVPKDGKTDRGICVEPSGNIWCQLAVGDHMKGRLKRVGLNVARNERTTDPIKLLQRRLSGNNRTGQDVHRSLAEMASRDGSLSTIDLRNASDTVARRLVDAILPDDWSSLLFSLRSPKTLFNKRWVLLEKFSSMGNGFTFELETLIFSCLAFAAVDYGVRRGTGKTRLELGVNLFVYGDDMIVPTESYSDVTACLETFGFEVNRLKSYSTGFFRESCGGDYYCGFDVRPFFVRSFPANPIDWMELYNGLRRVGLKVPIAIFRDEVPSDLRCYGPPGLNGVFQSHDETTWRPVQKHGIRWIRHVVPMPLRIDMRRWDAWSHLLLACLGVSSSGVTPPGNVVGFRTSKISIS